MLKRIITSSRITILILFFVLGFSAFAQNIQDTFTGTEIAIGPLSTNTTAAVLGTSDITPYTYLKLSVLKDVPPFSTYKFSLTLQVTPTLPDGTLDTNNVENIVLEVENNVTSGAGNIMDAKQYIINDSYGANVVVVSNSYEDNMGVSNDVTTPDNVVLNIGFNTVRYYELPENAPSNLSSTSDGSILQINWDAITEARYFDLEWTWIDNYDDDLLNPKQTVDIPFSVKDFERNSTRVQVTQNHYEIPITYSKGFIVYRVRAVGNFLSDITKNKYGPWTSNPYNVANANLSDWGLINEGLHEIPLEHEANKNWQFQASFAEDGKKKEVISYFDGSLRNRQTVTTINTNDNAVVGEVIYDAQGRPAVEVLPVPINVNELKFYEHFNKSTHPERLTKSYSYLDFDLNTQNQIDTPNAEKEMNDSSGATNYYSPLNSVTSEYSDQIPNAKKYPFSQIEYTPDNTGRIRRKSGVGETHQLGSGHEMEYYYGVPEQIELNRLFGYSVGNAIHYKKNMVLDPNRQLSVNYLDPQGRTIATALAGVAPTNLDALEDEIDPSNTMHTPLSVDLLNKVKSTDTDTFIDNNEIRNSGAFNALADQLTYNATKMVVFGDTRSFGYNVTSSSAFSFGCALNYNLEYDLEIDIINGDGESIFTLNSENPIFQSIALNGSNSITLDDQVLPNLTFERGTFTINKTLTVNREKVEEYADNYLIKIQDPTDPCYVPKIDIVDPLVIEGCDFDCDECEIALRNGYTTNAEAKAAYVQEQISLNQDRYNSFTNSEKNSFEDSLEAQWDEALNTCRYPCISENLISATPSITICQSALEQLLDDMSPLGQYGNDVDNPESVLNIFNESNELYSAKMDPSGTDYYSWKNPWHPDYDSSVSKTSGHYYNDDGSIAYVKVKEIIEVDENNIESISYSPSIDLNVQITLVEGTEGEYWVEPQFLENSSDFVALWEDNWAYSLLSYHPEYDYLLYSNALCELQYNNFSSDGFDAYLQSINTYADAQTAGFITGTFSSTNPDIFKDDPYFIVSQINGFETTALANARKQIMIEALAENFDGSSNNPSDFRSMMAVTYATIACNSLEDCPIITTNSGVLTQLNGETVENQDKFWNSYKANYLGLKQRIQSVFINAYAQKQGTYNGCIGLSEAPVALVANISTYDAGITSTLNSYLAGISPSDGICGDVFADNYLTKQKRYLPTDMYYNAGAEPSDIVNDIADQVNYDYYINSGTCPLTRDLMIYLDGYFKDINLSGNDVLSNDRDYDGLYLSPKLFEELGGLFPATDVETTGSLGSLNSELILTLEDGATVYTESEVTITLPGYDWNNYGGTGFTITEVSTITSFYDETNQVFQFDALAKLDVNGTYQEVVMSGTTNARITCSIDNPVGEGEYLGGGNTYDESGSCNRETYFSKAMITLLNSLIASNDINGTNVNLTNLNAYADGYLPEFFESSQITTWSNIGGNAYVLSIDGNDNLLMSLDTALPSSGTITNMSFEYVYNAQGDAIIDQSVKITWSTTANVKDSTQGIIIGLDNNLLNFLCCDDINNYQEIFDPYNYVYNGKNFSASNQAIGHTWSADGTILYMSFHNSLGSQYLCSTPFDVSTASLNASASIFGQGEGIHITSDGTYMIHKFRDIQGEIILYQFSTPHDISTMTEVSRVNISGILQDADIFMTDDGLTIYLLKSGGLTKYSLSAPFDLSSPTQEETLSAPGTGRSFTFSNDLKKLLIFYGSGFPEIRTYSLTTPGDLSTATLVNEQPFDAVIEGSGYNFPRIRISSDDNYLTVSTYGGAYPIYTFEKPLITQSQSQTEQNVGITPMPCNTNPTVCIPQPVAPVSCTDKYQDFLTVLTSIGDTEQVYTEEEFCNKQFAYITDDYIDYLTTFNITDPATSIHYLTIASFGATEFGYGYDPIPDDNINGMATIIDDYATEVASATSTDEIKTWAQFTSDYLYFNLTNGGTTCVSLPAPLPITTDGIPPIDLPVDTPCEQLTKTIYNTYSDDAYQAFLQRQREDFINAYLKFALENVVENFEMTYFDKEYQYTLYYYDQAGNLLQTVPPEGVKRFTRDELIAEVEVNGESLSLNDRINKHRNEDGQEDANLLPQHDYKTQYYYNSLNQLVWQFTPDGGETRFAYDALGRIVASQNAKQLTNNTFSYTLYDALGRILEAGEMVPNVAVEINQTTGKLKFTGTENLVYTNSFTNSENPVAFPKNISDQQNEVTRTKYNEYLVNLSQVFNTYDANTIFTSQPNKTITSTSRNRVTEVYYFDSVNSSTSNFDFDNAMYYNYDIHGNVKELVHHNRLLAKSSAQYSGLKHVEYEYDLISGNVNKVYYQKNAPDQFIHQYTYDADNRIVAVQTSSDGIIWEQDAAYNYYAHGPLARTVLGDKQVQGIDYAYTLQGWLKGVNANELDPAKDLGADGTTGSNVATDAMGFALTYYGANTNNTTDENDYASIGNINAFLGNNNTAPANIKNLYNGNIKQMATALADINETALSTQINNYSYDQLNRIKGMQGFDAGGNANYQSDYEYDNNGNLKALNRKADLAQDMDQLSYNYAETNTNPITGETTINNQLTSVTDNIGDIGLNDLGSSNTYTYDEIGQLLTNPEEGITHINWRVDGKVASIEKNGGAQIIEFIYDGLGNRIAKTVLPQNITTVYSRDAQGNVLAVYETNENDITNITANKNVTLKEHHIYGSSRLGIEQKNILIPEDGETINVQENLVLTTDNVTNTQLLLAEQNIEVAGNSNIYTIGTTGNVTLQAGNQIILKPGFTATTGSTFVAQIENIEATLPEGMYARTVGDKRYELSNHLGNVLSVITDRKIVADPLNFTNFTPDVLTYNDYYPFGSLLPNRHGSTDTYRYGFQGQEKDDEIKGEGNSLNYTFRMHDPRVGRFLSTDPLKAKFAWFSPYQFSGNRVIDRIELEGAETALPPYLWSSYATATNVYGKEGSYQTAYLISGQWHVQQSFSKSIYHNGNEWVNNFNHTTNKEFIEQNGYHHTMKELQILHDGGFFDIGTHDHDPWGRWVVDNPLPITDETIYMYGHAFQIDMDYLISLRNFAVAIDMGTIAGDMSFSMSSPLGKPKGFNTNRVISINVANKALAFNIKNTPINKGTWSGNRGNSTWYSSDPKVTAITKGKGIVYKNGRADFGPYAVDSFQAKGLNGGSGDRYKMLSAFAKRYKMTIKAAQLELNKNNLKLHHSGGQDVQVVPGELHGLNHTGGAFDLRSGN